MNQIKSVGAADDEFAHVAYIKDTCIFSYRFMFLIYSGIVDGHIVSGKRCHLCAKRNVKVCKWSILHDNVDSWPRQESNLDLELRKLLYYPLYYEAALVKGLQNYYKFIHIAPEAGAF